MCETYLSSLCFPCLLLTAGCGPTSSGKGSSSNWHMCLSHCGGSGCCQTLMLLSLILMLPKWVPNWDFCTLKFSDGSQHNWAGRRCSHGSSPRHCLSQRGAKAAGYCNPHDWSRWCPLHCVAVPSAELPCYLSDSGIKPPWLMELWELMPTNSQPFHESCGPDDMVPSAGSDLGPWIINIRTSVCCRFINYFLLSLVFKKPSQFSICFTLLFA